MTYEEEQAFLKRHIEATTGFRNGNCQSVIWKPIKKEIGRTSTRDGFIISWNAMVGEAAHENETKTRA